MRTINLVILIFILTSLFSCKQDSTKSIQNNESTMFNEGDTVLKTNNKIVVYQKDGNDTFVKYHPHDFNEFYVKLDEININIKLDFSKYEFKKMFYTVIKNDINDNKINFAGHYSFCYWGCGSPCKLSAVVDLKTGIVYNGIPAGTGYSFKNNSRLLIVNPTDSTNWFDITIPYAIPEEYEWTGKEFRRI